MSEPLSRRVVRPIVSAVASSVALLLLGACSSSDGADPAADASPSASASEDDPFAANLGEKALEVGETRRGREVETTLEEIRSPYPPTEYRQPEGGKEFLGLRIQQCAADDAAAGDTTYNGEWYAVTPSGEQYTSSSSWDDWPSPKFPEFKSAIPGRCVKGWIVVEVPSGTDVETVLWQPDGDAVAEWRVAS